MGHYFFRPAVFVFLLGFLSLAESKPGDTFRPYISATVMYDDNFSKVDMDNDDAIEDLGGKGKVSDTMTVVAAGLDVDWDISRQKFRLNAEINRNRFDNNDYLNNDVEKYNADWLWQMGSHLSGIVGYNYEKGLASFRHNRTLALTGTDHITQNYYLSGKWLLHPRWRVGGGVSGYESDYSREAGREASDRDDFGGNLSLEYISKQNNILGIKYRDKRTTYPARKFNDSSFVDNIYDLRQLLLTMDWKLTGKSRLKGGVGWENLENEHLDQRNYSDWSANLSYVYMPTGKLQFELKGWHELNPSETVTATYQRQQGVSLQTSWILTAKNSFNIFVEHERRFLEGDPGFINANSSFDDVYKTASVTWVYQPTYNFDFQFGYNFSQRESTGVSRNFDSNMFFATVKAQW